MGAQPRALRASAGCARHLCPPDGRPPGCRPGRPHWAYPPHWQRIAGDPGTVSAALVGADDKIVGYLNATPRQANETLSNWATFRPNHNAHEGDRHEHTLAATGAVPFRSGHASCVIDTYRTSRAGYREIACLVVRAHDATVIVAAATTTAWPHRHRQLDARSGPFRPDARLALRTTTERVDAPSSDARFALTKR